MRKFLLGGVALCSFVGLAAPALAQNAEGDDYSIVVTAQKREQNIQDIGIAVTALGEDALTGLGNRDIAALVQQVPSMQVTQYAPTNTVFNVRGVSQSDVSDGQEAPIAFYNDEVYVAAGGAISGQTFDLQRAEILRGPQGTLFGRNATGGLVQVITARPTDEFEAYLTVTGGERNLFSTNGAISGPLGEHVRGRLSFTTNNQDGYIENLTLGGEKGGEIDFFGGRAQLEFDLGATAVLRLKAEYLHNDEETHYMSSRSAGYDADGLGFFLDPDSTFWNGIPPHTVVPPGTPQPGGDHLGVVHPSDPYQTLSNYPGLIDREYSSFTANYEQQLASGVTFTSISNYQHLDKVYRLDSDATPVTFFDVDTAQQVDQFSQEFRLAGVHGPLTWVLGAYGMWLDTHNQSALGDFNAPSFFQAFWATQDYDQRTESLALFGQGEYELNDQFSVILGLRYTTEDKWESWERQRFRFGFIPGPDFGPHFDVAFFNRDIYPDLAEINYEDFSGKLELDWTPNDDTLLYVSVNRGIKGGGFSTLAFADFDASRLPYDEEVLTSYEAGFKLSFAEERLQFNGAAFFYDYDGYQAYTRPTAGVTIVTNQPAELSGVEFEMHARPLDGLTISPWVTYINEAEARDISLPLGRVTDRRMPQTPEVSAGLAISYDVDVGPGVLSMWTNWRYTDEQWFSIYNDAVTREDAYTTGDVRVAYELGSWEAAVFVNNVTDEEYRLYALDGGLTQGSSNDMWAPPRTAGASITYRFGAN